MAGFAEGILAGTQAYGNIQEIAQQPQRAAYLQSKTEGQNLQNQGLQSEQVMQGLKIDEAMEKKKKENMPIPLTSILTPQMAKDAPELHDLLAQVIKTGGLSEQLGGKTIIRQKSIDQLKELATKNHDFAVMTMDAMDKGLARKQQDITEQMDDLTAKIKVDKKGQPIKDEKTQGQMAQLKQQADKIKKQRESILQQTDQAYAKEEIKQGVAQVRAEAGLKAGKEDVEAMFKKYPQLSAAAKSAVETGDYKQFHTLVQEVTKGEASATTAEAREQAKAKYRRPGKADKESFDYVQTEDGKTKAINKHNPSDVRDVDTGGKVNKMGTKKTGKPAAEKGVVTALKNKVGLKSDDLVKAVKDNKITREEALAIAKEKGIVQ